MITEDLRYIANNYAVGQKVRVLKYISNEKQVLTDVQIVEKHPYFALVSNGLYMWAVRWEDLDINT